MAILVHNHQQNQERNNNNNVGGGGAGNSKNKIEQKQINANANANGSNSSNGMMVTPVKVVWTLLVFFVGRQSTQYSMFRSSSTSSGMGAVSFQRSMAGYY
mmetsp:Transcript_37260/g.90455  ORF Transcript_37260/g.90455 Transcript_37260/m.90455 type:complete len:101 (+) Transcript_37260:45-347(+)